MTIKELYELATDCGYDDAEIVLNFICDDPYYSISDYKVKHDEIEFDKNYVKFVIIES